jgi:hypothetical protein
MNLSDGQTLNRNYLNGFSHLAPSSLKNNTPLILSLCEQEGKQGDQREQVQKEGGRRDITRY